MFKRTITSSHLFWSMAGIGLLFAISIVFIGRMIFLRAYPIFASLQKDVDALCSCHVHFALSNHPIASFLMFLSAGILIAYTAYVAYKILKIQNSTQKYISRALKNKRPQLSKKLKTLALELSIEKRVIETNCKEPVIFCFGILKTRIAISSVFTKKLSKEELKAVLLHEYHHLKSYEPAKLFIVKSITKILFFAPGIKQLSEKYYALAEIEADQWTISKLKTRKPLACAVYKMIEWKERFLAEQKLALLYFGDATEERISKIVSEEHSVNLKLFNPRILAGLFSVILVFGFFSFSIYAADKVFARYEDHSCASQEDPNISTCAPGCSHAAQLQRESCKIFPLSDEKYDLINRNLSCG